LVLYFELSEMSAAEHQRAQTAAREFVETQMATQDLIRIMARDGKKGNDPTLLADFTNDRATLLAAIRNIPRHPEAPPRDDTADGSFFTPDPDELAAFNADRELTALEVAAFPLTRYSQRKLLVCFVTPRDWRFSTVGSLKSTSSW
jgi:hypothetical protein